MFRRGALQLIIAACLLPHFPIRAEIYPSKPVRVVIGYPPGGAAEFIIRTLSADLAKELGQPIIVDSRPGAGTNIASELVARAAPDGYTLLLGNNASHGINKTLYKKLNFDPDHDFVPITQLSISPMVIAVNAKLGIHSLQDLIKRAKSQPGKLNFASAGNGSPNHLAGVLFNSLAGVDMVHVPFKGGAPSVISTVAGDTQVIFGTPPVVLPYIRSGRLIGLCSTTRERSTVLPSIQSASAAGLPNLDVVFWFGLFAPGGTPQNIVMRLFDATVKVLAKSEMRERLAKGGIEAKPSKSPLAFQAAVRNEYSFWEKLVKRSGATVD